MKIIKRIDQYLIEGSEKKFWAVMSPEKGTVNLFAKTEQEVEQNFKSFMKEGDAIFGPYKTKDLLLKNLDTDRRYYKKHFNVELPADLKSLPLKESLDESMSDKEREDLRKLQNKVIDRLVKNGYDLNDKLGEYVDSNNKYLTVRDITNYLYPQFKSAFEDYLKENVSLNEAELMNKFWFDMTDWLGKDKANKLKELAKELDKLSDNELNRKYREFQDAADRQHSRAETEGGYALTDFLYGKMKLAYKLLKLRESVDESVLVEGVNEFISTEKELKAEYERLNKKLAKFRNPSDSDVKQYHQEVSKLNRKIDSYVAKFNSFINRKDDPMKDMNEPDKAKFKKLSGSDMVDFYAEPWD